MTNPECTCAQGDYDCAAHHTWLNSDDTIRCTGCDWTAPFGYLEDNLAAIIGHTGRADEWADRMGFDGCDPEMESYIASLRVELATRT